MGQIRTILSLLAYAPSTLATIFDFELDQKNLLLIRVLGAGTVRAIQARFRALRLQPRALPAVCPTVITS